ncbi:MAG: Uma2 family endonuclease [Defluviitaleaceae bacterium]|nr:Uma2 family endonuclease [Defluviitaleaceae bacterium]MCL2836311.1 Uma2 family endonuclease [Defluviitaleaceae bacterium]
MSEPAYKYEYTQKYEIHDGKIVYMAPSPGVNHTRAIARIINVFNRYLQGKKCEVFHDSVDVFLTKKDTFVPDMTVVCNPEIIKENGIHGAPDLVVEVLSPSTSNYDRKYKKKVYEKCGVREYWIVDIKNRAIEVYLPIDGKYELEYIYQIYPDFLIEGMTEDQKSQLITEFSPSIFPDLKISLFEIFERLS